MKKTFGLFALIALVVACSSSDENGGSGSNNYDRTALLTNWADHIIIPSFENYQTKVNDLSAKSTAFTTTPSTENLSALRASWLEAYKSYQYVSMYYFGKAEQLFLKEMANTYPTNTTAIESNIASGAYNLANYAQIDKQGFPALDYLINGLAINDAEILAYYTTNGNATGYKQYLTDVTARLKATADAIVTDWNSGYRETYISSNGTSVSSSVNKTANNFVKNLERDIRTAKVGIPAGELSNGVTFPDKVEAYYKGDVSKELLAISIKASKDFFNGKHFDGAATGEGFKSYLDNINAVRNGSNLSDLINAQFDAVTTGIGTLSNNFAEQINTDNSKMIAVHGQIQQSVILTKLDMMQALNITIDYVDGDGD